MGSYGGIPGEVEGSESGDAPTPGAPGSEDGLGRRMRMRITCLPSWAALRRGTRVGPSGWGAAAGPLCRESLPQPGGGQWAVRWCSYRGSPALSCGIKRTARHAEALGLTRR